MTKQRKDQASDLYNCTQKHKAEITEVVLNRQNEESRKEERWWKQRQWASKTESITVDVGNTVGFDNLWRFLYLCYNYERGKTLFVVNDLQYFF